MLYFEWKEEDALKYAKEEGYEDGYGNGAAQKQEEMIRKFSKINTPEQIAEILHVTKEYVLEVLSADGAMYACEPTKEYNIRK